MYQVIHIRKIRTSAGLSQVASHNSREKVYDKDGADISGTPEAEKWYNPEKSHLNNIDKTPVKDVVRKRNIVIRKANLKRKPQKNAAAAVEVVFSASPEFSGDWNRYFSETKKWAMKQFGVENLLQTAIHYDETTPHMHMLFVPIVEKSGIKKYSSGEFVGNRTRLQQLHTDYFKSVGRKHGLKRGEVGSRSSHQSLQEYSKQKKQLKQEYKTFSGYVNTYNNAVDEFNKKKSDYEDKQSDMWKAFSRVNQILKGLDREIINQLLKHLEEQAQEYRKKRNKQQGMGR